MTSVLAWVVRGGLLTGLVLALIGAAVAVIANGADPGNRVLWLGICVIAALTTWVMYRATFSARPVVRWFGLGIGGVMGLCGYAVALSVVYVNVL
jgi:drug/metabolite transporter (DMT)-like permease